MFSRNESFYYPINPNQRLIFELTFLSPVENKLLVSLLSLSSLLSVCTILVVRQPPRIPPDSVQPFVFSRCSLAPLLPPPLSAPLLPRGNLILASLSRTALVKHRIMGLNSIIVGSQRIGTGKRAAFKVSLSMPVKLRLRLLHRPLIHEKTTTIADFFLFYRPKM